MLRCAWNRVGPAVAVGCSALLAMAWPLVASAQTFEGAITVRMAGRGGQPGTDIEYLNRNGNVRVSLASPAGPVAILRLATEAKTYMVIESQKAYMEVPTADAVSAVAANADKTKDAKITRSGRRETIAGYECEHVIVEVPGDGDTQKTDVCITQALGRYVNPMAAFSGAAMAPWQRQLASEGGFPLKVIGHDGTVVAEVTRIEKKRVSDTQFRIPADFNKMAMPKRP
jgi:hypothetical protein